MNITHKKFKATEDTADTYKIHPDCWSADRNIRLRIKGKISKILDKLLDMHAKEESDDKAMSKLRATKDTLYDLARNVGSFHHVSHFEHLTEQQHSASVYPPKSYKSAFCNGLSNKSSESPSDEEEMVYALERRAEGKRN